LDCLKSLAGANVTLVQRKSMKEHYEDEALMNTTYYVRDVNGQVMAVYSNAGGVFTLMEQPVYGAGRIGIAYNGANYTKTYVYELTDHLGNVRAVFTKNNNDANLEGYTDYYPFGMPMPNRQMMDANGYRYKFQGQEKDPETGKEAFQLRLWDSRIGRWLTTDPYGQYNSPYVGMGNDPINGIDPDGGWKTKFGAWLWKTFNGGGEIVGEKGNWSVAQQGADGWDTFITNGEFDSFGYTSINSITTQVNSNTLIDYNTVTQEAKYKFLYPNDLGDWNTKGSDGKYWIGCLSCHSDSGAYRYAAYNSQERYIGNNIAITANLAMTLPLAATSSATGASEDLFTVTNQSAGKTNVVVNRGTAGGFYNRLNPSWNGTLPQTGYESFKTVDGTRVLLYGPNLSNQNQATVKIITRDNYKMIMRFIDGF